MLFQEENATTETFENYVYEGSIHPDKVCIARSLAFSRSETTVSEKVQRKFYGKLSGLQIEAVQLISERHKTLLPNGHRAGFVLGDGTGMGKTRVIAATILQYLSEGRSKHIFITVSSTLFSNLTMDLENLNPPQNFRARQLAEGLKFKMGILFLTYTELREKYSNIIKAFEKNFDGVIAFDECHMARSVSQNGVTGKYVVRMQEELPLSRVIYASATALSKPDNIAYLVRLGLWGKETSFDDSKAFVKNLSNRGILGMELLACDLTRAGAYISRQLSQDGVSNEIVICKTDEKMNSLYDASVKLWMLITSAAKKHVRRHSMSFIWQAHQNYFNSLCVWSKVPECIEQTRNALKNGMQVIIGIQSTGESLYKNIETPYTQPYSLLRSLLKKVLIKYLQIDVDHVSKKPKAKKIKLEDSRANCTLQEFDIFSSNEGEDSSSQNSEEDSNLQQRDDLVSELSLDDVNSIKKAFQHLDPLLPRNTLDFLITELGGETSVAELTGRKVMEREYVDTKGNIVYASVKRQSNEQNVKDRECFQAGLKKIVIISNVASIGISLHAENLPARENVSTRLHVTLEFPWSADRLVQQLGRSHRSNQKCPPKYLFLMTDIPGELRIVGTLASRVAHLSALTQGDRRSSVRVFEDFTLQCNGNASVVKTILENLLEDFSLHNEKFLKKLTKVGIFQHYKDGIKLSGNSRNFECFFNRMLGLPLNDQREIYKKFMYFQDLAAIDSQHDSAIIQVGENLKMISTNSCAITERLVHHEILFDTRMELHEMISLRTASKEHFFLQSNTDGKIVLAIKENDLYRLYSPEQGKRELLNTFIINWSYKSIPITDGEIMWMRQYEDPSVKMKTFHIISGDIFPIWTYLEQVLEIPLLKVVRVRKENGNGIYGLDVPEEKISKAKIAIRHKDFFT